MQGIIAAGFCSGGVDHSWESRAGVCPCFIVLSCCVYCLQLAAHGCSKLADGIAVAPAAGDHCAQLSVLLLDLADLVCYCVLLLVDCLLALRSAISLLHLGFN